MRTIKNLVFWQGSFSIHQSALLRSLAASGEVNVTLVVWEELSTRDSEKGWAKPDYGQTHIILGPTSKTQTDLLAADPSTTLHMFSGTRGHPMIWNAFRECLSSESHMGIRSEAYRSDGIKGTARLLRGRYDAFKFANRVDLILAVGTLSVNWYKRAGYPNEKIFPFAYIIETPPLPSASPIDEESSNKCFDLAFVGLDSYRKGLDVLLRALNGIDIPDWRLHLVGNPADKEEYTRLSAELGLTNRVHFYGAMPNSKVMDLIASSDLLVLPSRWDGWGAVVNEALMCGVPAVCSDRCGAADLLNGGERGEIFPSEDVSALRSVLARRIAQGKKNAATSQRIREWSKCIDGETGAAYLLAILDAATSGGNRPIVPWLQQDSV